MTKGDKYRTRLDSNPNLLLSISPLWLESEISEIEDEPPSTLEDSHASSETDVKAEFKLFLRDLE